MNSDIVKTELNKLGAFSGKVNKIMSYMVNSLDAETPYSMRATIANYALASFVGHFHTKIILGDDFIPTNFIGFVLAKSGAAKTSSVNKLERALGKGYDLIEKTRQDLAEKRAKEIADANEEDNYLKYLKPLNPLFISISTEAGMIKKLNDFREEGIGLPSLLIDEVGTELASNPDMVPNIKLISELYDLGNKKVRALKDETMQSAEVKGMAMSSLLIGSEKNILLDESVLKKFNTEFITKLARRSFFDFPEFNFKEEECNDIEGILSMELDGKEFIQANVLEVRDMSYNVAQKLIQNDTNNIMIDTDAERLYKIYKMHCRYQSEEYMNAK